MLDRNDYTQQRATHICGPVLLAGDRLKLEVMLSYAFCTGITMGLMIVMLKLAISSPKRSLDDA
jgi:hypothetical protein